jgi:hypothetical protein
MGQSIKIESTADTLQGGRIIAGNGMLPCRIVLRDLGEKFVTHIEVLTVRVEGDVVFFSHRDFENGHYFDHGEWTGKTREQAHAAALADFDKRLRAF